LRQFAAAFGRCFSRPQAQYFVTVLLALVLCQEARTLSGLLRQIADGPSVSGLSRFLAESPWSAEEVAGTWQQRFREQMQPLVEEEQRRQQAGRPKRRGRLRRPVVTGYLIGDDSTMHKPKGRKMAGLGQHYSTTAGKQVPGHSLVAGLYVLLGRQCPLRPRMYRQQAVCQAEDVPFQSKIEQVVEMIETFEPLPDTATHVLLDAWYAAKKVWQAARKRGFAISTGLKSNRWLRVEDEQGWHWQKLSDYVAGLQDADYQLVTWPAQVDPREVYVHVVQTRVRKLYKCQLIIVRESLTAPLAQVRYFASSDLAADLPTLIGHLATRWDIEVLFADGKELLGLDQYQVMSAQAILRFWTLALAAFAFLDEERYRLRQERQRHVTLGEARRELQRVHRRHLLDWILVQFRVGVPPERLYECLAA
jgi:hypothetical protein